MYVYTIYHKKKQIVCNNSKYFSPKTETKTKTIFNNQENYTKISNIKPIHFMSKEDFSKKSLSSETLDFEKGIFIKCEII